MDKFNLPLYLRIALSLQASFDALSDRFRVHNPRTLQASVFDFYQKRLSEVNSPEAWQNWAVKFWYWGDWHWPDNSIIGGTKSGWYYALSGWCFEQAGDLRNAGNLYHFTGHQFRRFQALEKAMHYYFMSAVILLKDSGDEASRKRADRSIRRAIGLSKESGNEAVLAEKMEGISAFQFYFDQFKTQNPWD
jgi:hypothetical protein